ncbi:unnamed protein product [Bathycoccus prasinos]
MLKVTTRAQKRRMGERDVWDLIVNNDDICFQHILPRLNGTDLKFLYEVNTETRKLKRSRRYRRWSLRGSIFRGVRRKVARTNKLELLKWIREEKQCKWDDLTIKAAARQGNLEMVKYCVANECRIDRRACALAALNGHLECLKYLHEEVEAPWDSWTADWAAERGHLHILEYLVERKYDQFDEDACTGAAMSGHLDCLKYLHETAKAPWDSYAVRRAHKYNQPECLQYCLDNNCPLPEGWSYVNGELHVPDQ